ncbi:PadR family transcriptional regulator [Luteipulveratus mongoliensis]|uniref:Transcriptional regulator n=1 Tax=Luteipulveratus mongoliensis TaxID=571913 RepID=A0A0K1JGW0_9MICO|nr:PadR family transcriptional regulator [Luteipulveratus mongoliensis]AKU15818.1 transcriptional regulator [Luteipulveratus mongoliensis]
MSLEHAILVSLAEQSASGYDLTRRFDLSLGFFWRASHQQIYRTLARMETDGTVASEVEAGGSRPDRKVYALTDQGRHELEAWTRKPTPPETVRSEFAVKVRGMQYGDRAAVVDDIRRQREHHVKQLDYYERNAAKHYPDPSAVAEADLPVYLVLRGGIRTEQTYVAWCDEMLDLLGPQPNSAPPQEKP